MFYIELFISLLSVILSYLKKKKLDGVGPVDKRPSTDKLYTFGRKKIKKL